MTETCASCLFFFTTTGSPNGLCKRYPPTVAALPGHAIGIAAFPIVVATEWCGEYYERGTGRAEIWNIPGVEPEKEESGDLHTANARRIWARELPWTGDILQDRRIADRPFYRDFSYRDMAKRGSHLSNFGNSKTSTEDIQDA